MSQDSLQAIIGRIARFNQTNDPAHILNPAAVSEADTLARDGVNDTFGFAEAAAILGLRELPGPSAVSPSPAPARWARC